MTPKIHTAHFAAERQAFGPPQPSSRLGLFVAAILAVFFSMAGFGTDNPSQGGPGSGLPGSFSPGVVQGNSSSDMGNGEVVDNLTGDLIVTHPIAIPLPAKGTSGISLARVYQSRSAESKPTDIDERSKYPYSWVGYRWKCTMGRISLHGKDAQQYWVYEGPGGDEHRLYSDSDYPARLYTIDGSYIRAFFSSPMFAQGDPTYFKVLFPDGSIARFDYYIGPVIESVVQPNSEVREDIIVNADEVGWYATRITDPFLNDITITYYGYTSNLPAGVPAPTVPSSGKVFAQSIYAITDNLNRYVLFTLQRYYPSGPSSPDGVHLLGQVTWKGYGAADRTESYTYGLRGPYSYPYFCEPQANQQVPFLVSVVRPGGFTVAYDYQNTDQMNAADSSRKGARLSDIYYPTGLRSSYVYAQDQYITGNLPGPPPGTLSPDTENWVCHAGVGVIERRAYFVPPDPINPTAAINMAALNPTSAKLLTWTWNRRNIRHLPQVSGDPDPHVVTSDPSGREVVHYYEYWSNANGYPSVAPFETKTAIFSSPYNYTNPGAMSIVKKVFQVWKFAREPNNNEAAGDVERARIYYKDVEDPQRVQGNPHVRSTSVYFDANNTEGNGYITIVNSGWDGYGHYEKTEINGTGVWKPGTYSIPYTTFQSYQLLTDLSTFSTKYCISRPLVKGAMVRTLAHNTNDDPEVSVTGYVYTPINSPNITMVDEVQNAVNEAKPGFDGSDRLVAASAWFSRETTDVKVVSHLTNGRVTQIDRTTDSHLSLAPATYTKTFEYDPATAKLYKEHMGGATPATYTYDASTGLPVTAKDENNVEMKSEYDTLDRPIKNYCPAQTSVWPSWTYYPSLSGGSVHLPNLALDVSFPATLNRVISHRGATAVSSLSQIVGRIGETGQETVTDGFGRGSITRTIMPDGTISAAITGYGPDGKAVYSSLPYTEGVTVPLQTLSIPIAYRSPDPANDPPSLPPAYGIFPVSIPQNAASGPVKGTISSVFFSASRTSPFPAFPVVDGKWGFDYLGRVVALIMPTTNTQDSDQVVKFSESATGFTRITTVQNIEGTSGPITESKTARYYNALGRLIGVDAPAGADAIYDYDVNGYLRASRLVDTLSTSLVGDLFVPGNPLPVDPPTFFECYKNGGINCLGGGQVRTYTMDALGRTTGVNHPSSSPTPTSGLEQGTQMGLAFDAMGHVLEAQDARALGGAYSMVYSYDSRGRLTDVRKKVDSAFTAILNNRYDSYSSTPSFPGTYYSTGTNALAGRIAESTRHNYLPDGSTDRAVKQVFSYKGPMGRLSDERLTIPWGNRSETRDLNLYYAGDGSISNLKLPDGQVVASTMSHGALTTRRINDVVVDGMTYDSRGAFLNMDLNYVGFEVGHFQAAYDSAHRLGSLNLSGTADEWDSGDYRYDGAGNVKQVDRSYEGSAFQDKYYYDAIGRVVKTQVNRLLQMTSSVNPTVVIRPRFFSYAFDPVYGNLQGRTELMSLAGEPPSSTALEGYLTASLPPEYQSPNYTGIPVGDYAKQGTFLLAIETSPPTNKILSGVHGPSGGTVSSTFQHDLSGNVTQDRLKRYDYDATGKPTTTKSLTGVMQERLLYAPSGERCAVEVFDASGARVKETTTVRTAGQPAWQETSIGGGGIVQETDHVAHLYASGRLAATTGETYTVQGGGLPLTAPTRREDLIAYALAENPAVDLSLLGVPELSEPSWYFRNGDHSDMGYEVDNITQDVSWVEVKKSRIKNSGKAPCHGSSCEDQVEVQRMERPEAGWSGPVPVFFADLQKDKIYQVMFRFASDACGHPALGPRVFPGGGEVLVCPSSADSLQARMRAEQTELGGEPKSAWRFSAGKPKGYTLLGSKATGQVTLATSLGGEDVQILSDDDRLKDLLAIQMVTADAALSAVLPGQGSVLPIGLSRTVHNAKFFATDHLGTVRAVYRADATFPTGSTRPTEAHLTLMSTHDYEPYGVELFPTDPTSNTIQYTGQERDASTGNDYMHFRFYQDAIGRFLKPDNIAGNVYNPQSFNRYSYVQGNPVNFNDPWGHAPLPGGGRTSIDGARGAAYKTGGGWTAAIMAYYTYHETSTNDSNADGEPRLDDEGKWYWPEYNVQSHGYWSINIMKGPTSSTRAVLGLIPKHWGLVRGKNVSGAIGLGGTLGYSWYIDLDGNIRLLGYYGKGVGSPSLGAGADVALLTGYDEIDPTGEGYQGGGSIAVPVTGLSGTLEGVGGVGYGGLSATLAGGVSLPMGAEAHYIKTQTGAISANFKEQPVKAFAMGSVMIFTGFFGW